MLHSRPAALLRATVAGLMIAEAACAQVPAAFAFEVVTRPPAVHQPHRAAWGCVIAGGALVGASFPLTDRADRRYHEYLAETDVSAIDGRWRATVRADRIATGALLSGEVLLVAGTWLGLLHRGDASAVAIDLGPGRCALSCRF